ncbi:MAG: transcriptional repressor LexA [Planctomycetota bacterium]
MGLTRKQTEVLAFIRDFIADRGFAPTLEEIGGALGVSAVTAREHVKALEAQGVIRTERNRARSIEIVTPAGEDRWPEVKVLGRVAAGMPIEALENPERFDFDGLFPENRDVFLLEVKGNSMVDDHIQDGDLVVCESRASARNGEVVVAVVDGDHATVKHFFHEGSMIRLEPANATMKAIIVEASRVQVRGAVIGVIRRF